jgi:DNA-directed RNA polymerase subunit F
MAGYSQLAAVIGKHHEYAIFRKFSVLNAKNLLYMQGELTHLEAELKMIAVENIHSKDPQKADFEFSISSLIASHASEDGNEHWAKILEIREKLKEYSS